MEVIKLVKDKIKYIDDLAVAVGQFDGLHLAHVKIITKMKEIAAKKNLKSSVITFDPHPDFVLKKQFDTTYITPRDEKIKIMEELDIDYLFIIPFTLEIASLEPKEFIKRYLCEIGVKEAVVGFDFTYGKYGTGNVTTIEEDADNLLNLTVIGEIKYENKKIGSSLVRELLKDGRVDKVKEILGRFYQVDAKVIKGKQIGQKIGIPTANLEFTDDFVTVKPGVYAVRVIYDDKKYLGVCNIGHNPSFNYQNKLSMEVHIFDFVEDIYGKNLSVLFLTFLRDEKKFASIEDFKNQITQDIIITKKIVTD